MKKRGRKTGQGSFMQVCLGDLNNVLKPNAKVIVWGRYANMLGLNGKIVDAKHDVLIASINSGKTELDFNDFNAEQNSLAKPQDVTPQNPEVDLVQKPSVSLEVF